MLTPWCCDNQDEFSVAILQKHVMYSVSASILLIHTLNIVVNEKNAVSSA
jgi:hypothetical protein